MVDSARKNSLKMPLLWHPSGNPYGAVEPNEKWEAALTKVKPWQKRLSLSSNQQTEFKFPGNVATKKPVEGGGSQNPYAPLSSIEEDAVVTMSASIPQPALHERGISKEAFRRDCRNVFLQYEPLSSSKTRLRREFTEFISENEIKPSETRADILERLRKYRIPANLKPHLNRERDDSLMQKLKEISEELPW